MIDPIFNFDFASQFIKVYKLNKKNYYRIECDKWNDPIAIYIFKRKGRWWHIQDGKYYTVSKRFLHEFLKHKDEWIVETILLGDNNE